MKRNRKPKYLIRWGTYYKAGKLYVFRRDGILVAKPWPELRAWRKTPAGTRWYSVRPDLFLGNNPKIKGRTPKKTVLRFEPELIIVQGERKIEPDWDEPGNVVPDITEPTSQDLATAKRKMEDETAFSGFANSFPTEVRAAIAPFPDRHWHVAVLLARCPGAMDLIRSNPALAYCLASSWVFRKVQRPLRACRSLVYKRQRDILGWLGFPATESAVRIFRKIEPVACNILMMLNLRRAMMEHTATVATLRHRPRIGATVLRIATDISLMSLTSPILLSELAAREREDGRLAAPVRDFLDTIRMQALLGLPPRRPFGSLAELQCYHDKLAAACGDLSPENQVEFPTPPYPGTEFIQPITTAAELFREGQELHHCAACYAEEVAAGSHYFYRVIRPDRATVSLARVNGKWEIEQLRGPCNRPVSSECEVTIWTWWRKQPEHIFFHPLAEDA